MTKVRVEHQQIGRLAAVEGVRADIHDVCEARR
jgi:hypothetical protein